MHHFRAHRPADPVEDRSYCPTAHLSDAEFKAMFPNNLSERRATALGKAIDEADRGSELWRDEYDFCPTDDDRLLCIFPNKSTPNNSTLDPWRTQARANQVRRHEGNKFAEQMERRNEKLTEIHLVDVRRELAKVVGIRFARERAEREKGRK